MRRDIDLQTSGTHKVADVRVLRHTKQFEKEQKGSWFTKRSALRSKTLPTRSWSSVSERTLPQHKIVTVTFYCS